jgi:anhydro-N-acetylmuramic acid kinase
MDGIDIALLRTDGQGRVERGPSAFVAYEAAFRRRIEAALVAAAGIRAREDRPGELAAIEREITLRHVFALREFMAGPALGGERPAVVGFHGQTVLHRPESGLTVQLGDGRLLASETGIPVVYDMRHNDMVHGGQGAPLVPAYHAALAASLSPRQRRLPAAFVNIGGIANITFVPEAGAPVAFDTGPGNVLIDQWMMRHAGIPYDQDGRVASEGSVVRQVVEAYLAHPFFVRRGPKSLDRHDFNLEPAAGLELADGARTLACVTARAILKSLDHLPQLPRLWVITGGGRRNPHIIADLKAGVGTAAVMLAEEVGLDGDAMEAEAWAYLAVRALKGLPLTYPSTTGCRIPVSGGILAKP